MIDLEYTPSCTVDVAQLIYFRKEATFMSQAKTVLITGANKGIGYETAQQLGRQGYIVFIGARDESRGQTAVEQLLQQGIEAHFVLLDVTDSSTIQSAVRQIEQQSGSLDVLINNAGVSLDEMSPPSQYKVENMRKVYDTNVFAVVELTQQLLPLLQKSSAGRIVNVSSGLGSLTQNSDPNYEYAAFNGLAYSSSKASLNAVTVMFAKEFKDTALKINAADPGYTATDFNGHTGPRSVEQAATIIVKLATLDEDGPTGQFFDENGIVPW